MQNLLHIDCSIRPTGSITRRLTALFAECWHTENPGGNHTYRDLGRSPIPHIDETSVMAALLSPHDRTEAQQQAWTCSEPLIAELRAADTVVIGVPMYNYAIPSTLKAWLDRVTIAEHMVDDSRTEPGTLEGKHVTVVTARGGAYGPGTPRAEYDFQEPYLRAALGQIGLATHLHFVHAEMTLAHSVPHLSEFSNIADTSRRAAEDLVRTLATARS